ncbi:hypothetical protein [Euzebya sp.]|uniref:hypothetical protein n=1 Tax=Euzebya sp. TaxID=1971409 RepID=UPI0035186076
MDITIAETLPPWTAGVVDAVLSWADVDVRDVALRVKRHGIRRAWFTSCDDRRCPLVATPPTYVEGPAAGRGHLYARKRDLGVCRSANPVVTVDRTRHWVTGRAYHGVPYPRAVPPGTRFVVTLKVPQVIPDGLLPADRTYHRAKSAGASRIETPADDLVLVLAHELHHVDQFRHGLPRSEVDAERAGQAVLRAWVAARRPGAQPAAVGRAV